MPNPEYITTRPTPEFTCELGVRRTCTGRGEQADPILISSETLSLFYIVLYWYRRGLEREGDRRSVCRFLFCAGDVDGRYSRVAKERTESYQKINGVNQEESELLCLLLFTDSNLLIHFSLDEGPRRRVVGHSLGPLVNTGNASKSVTP